MMRASELVKHLNEAIAEHGDCALATTDGLWIELRMTAEERLPGLFVVEVRYG